MSGAFWLGQGGGAGFPSTSTIASGPPPGTNPALLGGRSPARWTYPFAGYGQPLLEIPQNRFSRIGLAINAYLGEPIITTSTKLIIFLAFEQMQITVPGIFKLSKIPDWIPKEDADRFSQDYGNDPVKIAQAYVKQKCLELNEYLNLKAFFQGIALDMWTSGDGFVNICSNATPEEELEIWNEPDRRRVMQKVQELKAKMAQPSDGRGSYGIYACQALNPSAVWLYPDWAGRITHAKVVHLLGEGVWDLNLNNLIHMKAFTFPWVVYGIPAYISALKWVDIKYRIMDAMYVSAKRYITPREWLTIQGPESENKASLPPTNEQMDWAAQIIGAYTSDTPFVLPAGWNWNYLGAEGKVLKVEGLIEKCDDEIRTACGVSRTFTSGAANVPAYATSKLQAGVMYKQLREVQEAAARAIEGSILQRFCLFNGFFADDGTLIAPKVMFKTLPIQGDDSVEKKIETLGQFGWLSPQTAWEFEGMDGYQEHVRINQARMDMVEPWVALAPDLPPDQSPDRFMDNPGARETITEARRYGYFNLRHKINNMLDSMYSVGGKAGQKAAESGLRSLGRYLTEATLLLHSDAKQRMETYMDWEDQLKSQAESLKDKDALNEAAGIREEVKAPQNGVHET